MLLIASLASTEAPRTPLCRTALANRLGKATTMLRRPTRRQRPPLVALLLMVLILLGAVLPARSGPALAAQAPLAADPSQLSISLPLGKQQQATITLTNTSGATTTPAIYEAQPAQAPGLTLSASRTTHPRSVALPQQVDRIDPPLLGALAGAPDRQVDFLVYLRDQADLSTAYTIADWRTRGEYVYQTLVAHAASSQRDLRQYLTARGLSYRPFWIVNAVLVHGRLADVQALAQRSDVALVRANRTTTLAPVREPTSADTDYCSPDRPGELICWNIRQIGADRVWRDFGITGQGVVVANIDTGVSFSHPALVGQYRGYLGPGRYMHDHNWFDPHGIQATPADSNGHGTHTMGTIVGIGDAAAGRPAVGVAPGARWIAAKGCGGYVCSEADLIAAAQWVLAPTAIDGSQPRPDLRPMIVNNSWAGEGGDQWYAGYTAAWRAAGIFPVFAAGNAGGQLRQVCGSIASPADYADVVAVGATDGNDAIASFSLLGPAANGRLKPDVVAPGTYQSAFQGVLSTYPDGAGYRTLQGTSMAAPHVAGLVALLWSANPALIGDYDTTYAILSDTARRKGDTRCGDPPGAPNNVYGYGRIDAYAAVLRARVDVPWLIAPTTLQPLPSLGSVSFDVTLDAARVPGPGTYHARLQIFGDDLSQPPATIAITMQVTPGEQQAIVTGRVVSAATGAPVQALVGVSGGLSVPTDSSGSFSLTLALGSYDLVASAPAFFPAHRTIDVTGDMRLPDLMLQPDQPRIAIGTSQLSATLVFAEHRKVTIPIANTGTRPLHYHVQVLPDTYSVWRSDEPGGPAYRWIDLPPGAPTLDLDDNDYTDKVPLGIRFPFFGGVYTETLVTSDGMLAFSLPMHYAGPASRCLPAEEFYFYMIAPFRADLDPRRGGVVRYGTAPDGATFVLSYENVPLHTGLPDATYTFQVLLHSDGRIVFQYQKLAALPDILSVGVQHTLTEVQPIGCGPTTPIGPGLAIELRPQTPATVWLASDTAEGELPPDGRADLAVTLAWIRPDYQQPYRARLEILSSDPLRPKVVVPVQVGLSAAPYERWFPVLGQRS